MIMHDLVFFLVLIWSVHKYAAPAKADGLGAIFRVSAPSLFFAPSFRCVLPIGVQMRIAHDSPRGTYVVSYLVILFCRGDTPRICGTPDADIPCSEKQIPEPRFACRKPHQAIVLPLLCSVRRPGRA